MTLSTDLMTVREESLRRLLLAAVSLLAIAAALVLGAAAANAHGNPEVSVQPNPVAYGGEATIEGVDFEEEIEVNLILEGALEEMPLGSATTDSEGVFSLTVALPSTAAPGSYRIRAVGPEGVAIANVRIQEAAGGTAPPPVHAAGVGFHRLDSTAEIAGFAGLAAALVVIGAALVWLPRERRHA